MKKTEPQSIRQIIDKVMDAAACDNSFMEQRASAMWPLIVGPDINRHTTRRFVRQGTLHVFLDSGPLKNELSFTRDSLMKSINQALGRDFLTGIQFH